MSTSYANINNDGLSSIKTLPLKVTSHSVLISLKKTLNHKMNWNPSTFTNEKLTINLVSCFLHDQTLHWPTKNYFFQNALEFFVYSGTEWCPKHDVGIKFSLN